MPTTIFYALLVLLTSAPLNFFWFCIAVIVDLLVSGYLKDNDSEWE